MWEDEVRPIVVVLVLVMMVLLVVALVAHFVIRGAVRSLVQRATAAQLVKDHAALCAGKPLRQIDASKAETSKVLLEALRVKV